MKSMNLPNKLTVLRVVLIPFFMFCLLFSGLGERMHTILALVIFAAASLTDMLDGKIARSQNLVTTFGKFLDPLADKLLVMVALISFAYERWIDPVSVAIILSREFMVTGLRLVVAGEGVVVAAGIWGKLKTAFTMVAMIAIMFLQILFPMSSEGVLLEMSNPIIIVNEVLIWIAVVLTVISGWIYLKAYGKYIDPNE